MKKQKLILGLAVLLVIVVIVAFIMGKAKAAQKRKKLLQIDVILENGIGANGVDVDSVLLNVKTDTKYDAKADAQALIKAQGFFTDDETKVFSILSGKTKAQLSTLNQTMMQLHGKSLKLYIEEIFKSYKDMGLSGSYPNYERALTIIKSAK
ncbi:hypothetical protein Q0590_25120 [Rhodocytophaga aerolata]|uniref:Uncharacterized protein n=1 Tax=Rhodocytophaga aerolata TaxID=455078 RepID=A0ABT8RBU6_9BACT|nr:hypothetical protein [Rhodocytophaga aerolata]MDO1449583.1 hypothetical protein [Rhodocytophaga aerolata]